MKKLALLSISLCAVWSGAAAAADMAVKYVPPRPCCEGWQGFYFGAYFGSGAGKSDMTFTDQSTNRFVVTQPGVTQTFVSTERGAGSASGDATGSVVDLFVGYNFQPNPSFVWGVQVEGTVFSDITLKSIGTRSFNETQTQTTVVGAVTTVTTSTTAGSSTFEDTDELRSMFAFVGRAGFLATPNILFYGLGGGTLGNFVVPDSDDPFGGKRSKWVLGYTAGAGIEGRLNKNWLLRAEYRYVHFDIDRDRATSDTQTTIQGTTTVTSSSSFTRAQETKFDFHLGKVGVVYRFCYCD